MFEIFGIPSNALFAQLLVGLINGSFYALLSLGLAVIFGMLNIINFTHGAQYMMGAFAAFLLLNHTGLGYWGALIVAPIVVGTPCYAGCGGWVYERLAEPTTQYYYVNQGPTYSGPGMFAPYPTYQESAVPQGPAVYGYRRHHHRHHSYHYGYPVLRRYY